MKVAKDLLGKILVHGKCRGRIVETEAYCERDPASHSFCGKTKRNAPMFGPPGTAYVYFSYGNHWLFNVVTEPEGKAGAVLIRAIEPMEGIKVMMRRRKNPNLTNGPARLTQAFGINGRHNSVFLNGKLRIEDSRERWRIVSSKRIGIKKAVSKKWRFYIKGNKWVSRKGGGPEEI